MSEEETGEEETADDRDVIDPSDFQTLELTLEEARRQYDDEETRRDTVENKIGIVVTVDALLISFGALFNRGPSSLALVVILLPALVSAGLGLHAIRSRDYERPGKNIWNFYDYSEYDRSDAQREQLLLDYVRTTGKNKEKNDPKFGVFNICIKLTFASLVLLLVTPVVYELGLLDTLRPAVLDILSKSL
jgi:multisubunit Na+/H+ antiporter MnhG subunit